MASSERERRIKPRQGCREREGCMKLEKRQRRTEEDIHRASGGDSTHHAELVKESERFVANELQVSLSLSLSLSLLRLMLSLRSKHGLTTPPVISTMDMYVATRYLFPSLPHSS